MIVHRMEIVKQNKYISISVCTSSNYRVYVDNLQNKLRMQHHIV